MHTKVYIQVVDQRIRYSLFSFRWYIKYVNCSIWPLDHTHYVYGLIFHALPKFVFDKKPQKEGAASQPFLPFRNIFQTSPNAQKTNQICHVCRGVIVDALLSSMNIPCRPDNCCHSLAIITDIRSGNLKEM